MIDKKRIISVAAALAVLGAFVGFGAAQAGGDGAADTPDTAGAVATAAGDDDREDDDAGEADEQVTDRAVADRAAAAARKAAGGGTVTEIERADEGDDGYEVEVRRANGTFAEVELDPDFSVVAVEDDDD